MQEIIYLEDRYGHSRHQFRIETGWHSPIEAEPICLWLQA
jgi:hypothetical protein